MKFDPQFHNRQSIRLKGYDYARAGAYFVTICTQHRDCLFGEIVDGEVALNEAGQVLRSVWKAVPERFPDVVLDSFVTMPNHVHGILWITTVGAPLVGAQNTGASTKTRAPTRGAPTSSLGEVVGAFKSLTTNAYITGVKMQGWSPFPGRLWQRNYFERIIRNDDELYRARKYIEENPLKWAMDPENPNRNP